MVKILVASNDEGRAAMIGQGLASAPGFTVQFSPPPQWLRDIVRTRFDLVLGLDDSDFVDRLDQLRAIGANLPVIVVTTAATPEARVRALRAGADDVVDHRCLAEELLLRATRLTRRTAPCGHRPEAGGLVIDRIERRVWRDDREIHLLPREFQLLMCLARHPGAILDRRALLATVWRLSFDPGTNVVEVHMSRLRAKIDRGFGQPLIETVKGAGYRFAHALQKRACFSENNIGTGDSAAGACTMTFTERAGA
ncbi:response regulator transcription factor [Sphingomonas cavernae]|nr:response regulator transcription factor [Sphingomonas cavernae]